MAHLEHESDMQNAIDELEAPNPPSLRAATEKWGVKKSTLSDRRKGKKPRQQAQSTLQLLTPVQVGAMKKIEAMARSVDDLLNMSVIPQETVLIEWINHLGMLGQPLEARTISPYVRDLSGRLPGVHWLARFLKRNAKRVRYCRTMALDPKRAMCFNYPAIKAYFEQLKALIETYEIPWENIYNMDEKGCQGAMSDPDHSTYIRTSPVSPARKESNQHPRPNQRYKPRTSPVGRGNLDLEFHESSTSSERNPGSPQRPADNRITGTGTDMVLDMD